MRKIIRKILDSFYSRKLTQKKTIGSIDKWTILIKDLNCPLILSGGIGQHITFELEMITRYNATIHLFDPSPTAIKTMDELKPLPNNIKWIKKGLAKISEYVKFENPEIEAEGSFRLPKNNIESDIGFDCISITDYCKENNIKTVDILKLDIEGFEYEVLENILNSDLIIKQICVEFHHFFDSIPKLKTKNIHKKLLENNYKLFNKTNLDYSYYKQY